jgi:hypothetical protein
MTQPNASAKVSNLRERLVYLRSRRWVRLLLLGVVVMLVVWGYFYIKSILPRTPAQKLELRTESLRVYIQVQEAAARLELLKSMIIAGREQPNIERHRRLIAEGLEVSFEAAPLKLRKQWRDLETTFKQLQADLTNGREAALATLTELEAQLQMIKY